ncbi:MAG TPA: hypothetical protein VJQ26_06860 [Ktedonobacteraceae bacterium]|nr:hypothetical protein [Ktedonobacteraceae bacterium]
MRRLYAEKWAVLVQALSPLQAIASVRGLEAGLHAFVAWDAQVQIESLVQNCLRQGILLFWGGSIDLKRFLDSGIALVECPDCVSTRTLSLRRGRLKFPSHASRKTPTPTTHPRWTRIDSAWDAVGS